MYAIFAGMLFLSYYDWVRKYDKSGITLMLTLSISNILGGLIQFLFICIAFKSYQSVKNMLLCPYNEYGKE